jgi:hypothetical protein
MARNPQKHKQQLLEALERNLGLVTPSCKEVGISRNQFYSYCHTDADFKQAVDEINEATTDFVENQLYKKIKEGSEKSILFYMKYKGRGRGYTESIQIDANVKIEQPLLKPLDDKDDIDNINKQD